MGEEVTEGNCTLQRTPALKLFCKDARFVDAVDLIAPVLAPQTRQRPRVAIALSRDPFLMCGFKKAERHVISFKFAPMPRKRPLASGFAGMVSPHVRRP